MTRQPIDEISCCNCPSCQMYILALEKRIARLERLIVVQEMYKPVNPTVTELTAAELDAWFEDVFGKEKT